MLLTLPKPPDPEMLVMAKFSLHSCFLHFTVSKQICHLGLKSQGAVPKGKGTKIQDAASQATVSKPLCGASEHLFISARVLSALGMVRARARSPPAKGGNGTLGCRAFFFIRKGRK